MGIEIERKFLLKNSLWRVDVVKSINLIQGYISCNDDIVVRVRSDGTSGYLTIKNKSINGMKNEFEYKIPLIDCEEILNKVALKPYIKKVRHIVKHYDNMWEVDEFLDENFGLFIAEIELDNINQKIIFPNWLGEEVTNDFRYYNSYLFQKPYSSW